MHGNCLLSEQSSERVDEKTHKASGTVPRRCSETVAVINICVFLKLVLIKYLLHRVESTFVLYSSMSFDTQLHDHHHTQCIKYFHHPKRFPCATL